MSKPALGRGLGALLGGAPPAGKPAAPAPATVAAPEFAERVGKPFLATLDSLEANAAVKRVVAVTHVPLLKSR